MAATADEIARTVPGPPSRHRRIRWADLAAIVVLVVLALVAVLPQVDRQAPLSALDEPSHLDYAYNASQLRVPAAGDRIVDDVRAIWNCYGNELIPMPACGTTGPEESYPALGLQYNFGHPPVYYVVTGFAARGIQALTDWDFLTAARGMGALWLAAGMAVMHLALRRLGVGVGLAAAVAAMAGIWWPSVSAATIVTNDAPFLLTTALGVLALGGMLTGRRGGWLDVALPIALAALAAGVKVMNALPFLALAGALVILALLPERYRPAGGRWRLIGTAAGMVGAVGAVYVLWTRFQRGRGDPDFANPVEGVNTAPFVGSPIGEWLPTIPRGLTHMGHNYVANGAAMQEIVSFAVSVTSIMGLAAIAIGLVVARRGSALAVIALAALVGAAAWPLIVQLQSFASSGGTHYFPTPSHRYGVTVGVLAFVALALVAERLRWQRFAIAGCLLVVMTTLVALAEGPGAG